MLRCTLVFDRMETIMNTKRIIVATCTLLISTNLMANQTAQCYYDGGKAQKYVCLWPQQTFSSSECAQDTSEKDFTCNSGVNLQGGPAWGSPNWVQVPSTSAAVKFPWGGCATYKNGQLDPGGQCGRSKLDIYCITQQDGTTYKCDSKINSGKWMPQSQ